MVGVKADFLRMIGETFVQGADNAGKCNFLIDVFKNILQALQLSGIFCKNTGLIPLIGIFANVFPQQFEILFERGLRSHVKVHGLTPA